MTLRGRKIVLLAHCLLNANSRVDGLARYSGIHPVVRELDRLGVGVIQLPCPELQSDGLARPPRAVEDYDTPEFRALCATLAEDAAHEVRRYADAGVEVVALVGVEGSPSCGVTITNSLNGAVRPGDVSVRTAGSGVFASELRARLAPLGVDFVAVDGRRDDLGVGTVLDSIGPRI